MRPFPIATCFLELVKKFLFFADLVFACVLVLVHWFFFQLFAFLALGSSCTMTKRDSLLAGFTYPSSSMSMPRRHSWRSRSHGLPSSTAAPSNPFTPSRSDTDPIQLPMLDLPSYLQDQVTIHPTMGTQRQTLPHPFQLLPITRLQFFQDLRKKLIHSKWNWQKLVASFTHTTLLKFKHLQMTIPNRHFADLW